MCNFQNLQFLSHFIPFLFLSLELISPSIGFEQLFKCTASLYGLILGWRFKLISQLVTVDPVTGQLIFDLHLLSIQRVLSIEDVVPAVVEGDFRSIVARVSD